MEANRLPESAPVADDKPSLTIPEPFVIGWLRRGQYREGGQRDAGDEPQVAVFLSLFIVLSLACGRIFQRETKMIERILAYCGLVCNEDCPALRATRSNDESLLRETAKRWSSPDYVLDAKDILCDGCTAKNQRLAEICSDCGVRACAEQREIANCALCQEYPCQQLEHLWEVLKNPQARARLDQFQMEASITYF